MMLLHIDRLVQKAADKPAKLKPELVNPASIERVREAGEYGGESCVEVFVCGEWVRCLGTVQQVGHAVNELLGIYDGQAADEPAGTEPTGSHRDE